jgi:hypothetical protein
MSVPQAWMVSQGVGKWKLCPLMKLTSTRAPGSLLEPPKVDPSLWTMMMQCRRGIVSTTRSEKAAASILAEIQPAYTPDAPRRYTSDGEVVGFSWCCESSLFKAFVSDVTALIVRGTCNQQLPKSKARLAAEHPELRASRAGITSSRATSFYYMPVLEPQNFSLSR